RAHARAADLVDDIGRHLDGDARAHRGLTCGVLTLAGGQYLPQDYLGDLAGLDLGTLQGLRDDDLTELVGGEGGERAVEGAERRGARADDDDVAVHPHLPRGSA